MKADETHSATRAAIRAVYQIESARLVAGLARFVRDVGLAEELAQDALVAALEQWPDEGIPDKPGAWLMTAAKHRGINALKRRKLLEQKHEELGLLERARELRMPDPETAIDEDVGDDLLRLVLVACHPVLPIEGRVALTLRLLGGLTTEEIARAFLVPEATIAQRIVRAKRTLAEARVPFEVPRGEELARRLSSVMGVIYLVFNEGYAATAGDDLIRPELCADALRLGRMLAELTPEEPEVHGLVALMELNASRARGRVDAEGDPVLLLDQDRGKWDAFLIHRGRAALKRAEAAGGNAGPYTLQAAIAACHARALVAEDTDWKKIADLYGALAEAMPSPVVRLNRAMAVAMAHGAAEGLPLLDALVAEGELADYPFLPSARADLLAKLGRVEEALAEIAKAVALTKNERQRGKLRELAARISAR